MAQEPADIAISKDNIKISYRRYLSDSSAGLMLLILLIAFFYKDISSISATLPSEVVAFVGLILFLLATPVGIAINVMSWFSLEGSQTMTERQIIADKFNIFWSVYREKGTRKLRITRVKPKTLEFFQKEYLFEKVKEHFSLSDETWGSTYEKLKTHLELDAPSLIYAIEPVRGVSIFLRNTSFMLISGILINLIYYLITSFGNWNINTFCLSYVSIYLPLLLVAKISISLSGITMFYFTLQVFFWAYMLGYTIKDEKVQKPLVQNSAEKPDQKYEHTISFRLW